MDVHAGDNGFLESQIHLPFTLLAQPYGRNLQIREGLLNDLHCLVLRRGYGLRQDVLTPWHYLACTGVESHSGHNFSVQHEGYFQFLLSSLARLDKALAHGRLR